MNQATVDIEGVPPRLMERNQPTPEPGEQDQFPRASRTVEHVSLANAFTPAARECVTITRAPPVEIRPEPQPTVPLQPRRSDIDVAGQARSLVTQFEPIPSAEPLVEQRSGYTSSRAAAFAIGRPSPVRGEAADLLWHLWTTFTETNPEAARWNGMQAAAWIASRNMELASKAARNLMEYRTSEGLGHVHPHHLLAALRLDIAKNHCACGSPPDCNCLDYAFGRLNLALRSGELFELGQQFRGAVNLENARGMVFSRRDLLAKFPPGEIGTGLSSSGAQNDGD